MAAWLPKGDFRMRKLIVMAVVMLLMLGSVPATPAEASKGKEWLGTELLSQGAVTVTYSVKPKVTTKLMIAKGKESYTYNLNAGQANETFPLQLGNGEYKITVLEHVSDKRFRGVLQGTVTLNLKDEKAIYLNSVQNVSWTSSSKAIVQAAQIAKGKKTDEEKAKAVYDYIVANIAYDKKLAANVPADYLPDIDRTLISKKDICYGYASLTAAMLRSLDIPTKLVMGDSEYVDVYHAWNEVYLNGKWVIIDTTVDAGLNGGTKKTNWLKDASKYTVAKTY